MIFGRIKKRLSNALIILLVASQFALVGTYIFTPKPAQAFWGIGDFTFNTEVANWYDIFKDIGLAAAQRIAISYANKYLTRFVDKVIDKYRIKDYLAYDKVLSGYYLNQFIYQNVDDPDLRAIYGILATDINTRATVTDPTGKKIPVLAALKQKMDKFYLNQGGIDPNRIYYPSATVSDAEYFRTAQAYFSNPPSFSEQNLYGEFGRQVTASQSAAAQEVAAGNGYKNDRSTPTGLVPHICANSNAGPYQPEKDPRTNEANCVEAGGTWEVDKLGIAQSVIQNPSSFIHDFATNGIKEIFANNFEMHDNLYTTIGSLLGDFVFKKLSLNTDQATSNGFDGTFNEKGSRYIADSGSVPMVKNLDVDGDNIPDGQDSDGDGKLNTPGVDNCYHGGIAPNCKKSTTAVTSPYFTPICQSIDNAVTALTEFTRFINTNAGQFKDNDNFFNKADADVWARRAGEANSAMDNIINVIQNYHSPYFDNLEFTVGRYNVFLSSVLQSLQKDKDLDLSSWPGSNGGGGLGNLKSLTASVLQYLTNIKGVIGKCEDPNLKAVSEVPPPVIIQPAEPPPCTAQGQDEQDFMLPLLNDQGRPPQEVADRTNQRFGLTTGNQAVYFSDTNTIGLPEFYAAGPTASRPVSPTTGRPWDIVSRCDSGTGGNFPTCADQPNAIACTRANHTDVVQRVKDYLVARGVSISGNCGAFEITKRVAWFLRGEGGGVLTTFHSGQCNGLASDIVAYPDNSGADILGDGGGANTPQWLAGPPGTESGVHYAPPSDPGDPPGSY